MKLAEIVKECRIDKPRHFRLADHDPAECFGLSVNIDDVKHVLADNVARLEEQQELLYADGRWAVLLLFQGMDAAGKDGTIKHVLSGLNPEGCAVHAFKEPNVDELEHEFLWQAAKFLPARGQIGIFNRSYYEEVLIVRVHPEMLKREKLPASAQGTTVWQHRFEDICAFERLLSRNGTLLLKFHLRLSKAEQHKRFLARLEEPAKRWKFSMSDVIERRRWNDYMAAYDDMIRATSTDYAPWYVVPADHKHVAWLIVSAAIVGALEALKLEFPKISGEKLKELKAAEQALLAEASAEQG